MTQSEPKNGSVELGYSGENLAREVTIPLDRHTDGAGTFLLLHRRPNERGAYPVRTERQGRKLIWLVTAADTEIPGEGEAELRWLGPVGEIEKTRYRTRVRQSFLEAREVPEVQEGYLNDVARNAQAARDAAGESRALYQRIREELAEGLPTPDLTDLKRSYSDLARRVDSLERQLRDILEGTAPAPPESSTPPEPSTIVVADIASMLVSYFENKTVQEVEA